jgi:hypothetical protein
MVSALAAVNIYRFGYLLIFLGRITTPTGFGLSISFVGDNLGSHSARHRYSPGVKSDRARSLYFLKA